MSQRVSFTFIARNLSQIRNFFRTNRIIHPPPRSYINVNSVDIHNQTASLTFEIRLVLIIFSVPSLRTTPPHAKYLMSQVRLIRNFYFNANVRDKEMNRLRFCKHFVICIAMEDRTRQTFFLLSNFAIQPRKNSLNIFFFFCSGFEKCCMLMWFLCTYFILFLCQYGDRVRCIIEEFVLRVNSVTFEGHSNVQNTVRQVGMVQDRC